MKENQNSEPKIYPVPSGTRWTHFWYLLLLFYIAAVMGSVYVRHDLAKQYEQALQRSQIWSAKFRHYTRLGRLMTSVDVLESKTPSPEQLAKAAAQIEEIHKEFSQVFQEDTSDLSQISRREEAETMLKDLELIKRSMDELIKSTALLVQELPEQNKSLPRMEASFRKVLKTYGRLRSRVAGVEDQCFQEQLQAVQTLERAEYVICFLLVSLVGGVSFYGKRLEHQTSQNLKEKEDLLTQVQEADGKYRALFENASEGIFQINADGRFIIANPALAQMCGYSSPAELLELVTDVGTQFYANPLFWTQFLHDVRRKTAVSTMETEVQCKDGTHIWVEQNLHAVEEAPGKIAFFEGTLKNITDQKWAELRRTLDYLLPRIVAESASINEAEPGVLQTLCEILDLEMGVGWKMGAGQWQLNALYETGESGSGEKLDLKTRVETGSELIIPENRNVGWLEASQAGAFGQWPDLTYARGKGLNRVYVMRLKVNGSLSHLLNLFSSKKPEPELLCLLSEVAAQLGELFGRKQNEEALRESEALKAAIFESSLDSMVTFDQDGVITDFNPAAERAFGYSREQVIGKDIGRLIVSSSFREVAPRGAYPVRPQADSMLGSRVELTAIKNDHTEFPVEMSVSQISHNGQKFYTAYIREISDRKRAERIRSELAAVVESSSDAIIGLSPDGNILSWNSGAEAIFGFSAQEVVGQHIYILVPPDRIEESARNLQALRRGQSLANHPTVRLRKGGKRIDVALTESPIRNSSGAIAGISLIARDITETKQLQEQFLQSQKMEAVGTLAGGIAHDFNNILTAIIGYTDLTLRQISEVDPFHKNILGIKSSAEFAATLTHQLLAFSRRQTLELTVFPINESVLRIQKLLHRLIGENINILTSLNEEAGRIKADQGQMEQVIMNLAVNARDAMPRGGVLTLETSNVAVEEADLLTGLRDGSYVKLSISDTGHGMSSEVREHLFEPFFTTKEKGKGTGLGLATCYGIIKQIGGHILVDSTPGEGTTFHLYFPRVLEAEISAKPAVKPTSNLPRGTETVLLVEDEETVRTLSAQVLRRLGYEVIEAADCDSAREIIQNQDRKIDLLLSDVVLPNSSGKELAEWAGAVDREMKVLLMSGYLEDSVFKNHGLQPEDAFLQKPFSPGTLAQKVRDVIDAPRA